jgi:hypothetical protein
MGLRGKRDQNLLARMMPVASSDDVRAARRCSVARAIAVTDEVSLKRAAALRTAHQGMLVDARPVHELYFSYY